MSKRCAYCDQPGKLTREHVWPKCFMEREGHEAAHFSVVTQSVHKADYVVKDVCQQCNSKLLAPLDAYFCELYDRYFVEPRDFDSTVVFRFDSDRLTRALLKIAYNTARGGYKDVGPFLPMRKYLLGLEPRPTQLAVFLVLLSPSLAPSETDPGVQDKTMPYNTYRSSVVTLPTSNGKRVLTRLVAVRSFCFFVVLPLPSTSEIEFEGAVEVLETCVNRVVPLGASVDEVVVRSSTWDWLRPWWPHLKANEEQYNNFFSRKKP